MINYISCHGNEQHTTLTTEQWNDLERFKRVSAKEADEAGEPAGFQERHSGENATWKNSKPEIKLAGQNL